MGTLGAEHRPLHQTPQARLSPFSRLQALALGQKEAPLQCRPHASPPPLGPGWPLGSLALECQNSFQRKQTEPPKELNQLVDAYFLCTGAPCWLHKVLPKSDPLKLDNSPVTVFRYFTWNMKSHSNSMEEKVVYSVSAGGQRFGGSSD